jgi:hypothetical protein
MDPPRAPGLDISNLRKQPENPSDMERTTGFEPAIPPWQAGPGPNEMRLVTRNSCSGATGYQAVSVRAIPLAARLRHVCGMGAADACMVDII